MRLLPPLLLIFLVNPSHSLIALPDYPINASVTYPGIGTFHMGDFDLPRFFPLPLLPFSPCRVDMKFILYTRSNRQQAEVLRFDDTASISASKYFSATKPTKVIVPGWTEDITKKVWISQMRDAFLDTVDVNVFLVDWLGGSVQPYIQAVVNAHVAGPMVAIQIRRLVELKGAKLAQFHLVSHSLGCHVAGYAGKFLNGQLGWITGLDPAGPVFDDLKPEDRLAPTDALFVDVIHTNGQTKGLGMGITVPCGTVDLYPNGGETQPGCPPTVNVVIDPLNPNFNWSNIHFNGCSHYRSWAYYIEAIQNGNSEKTKAFGCPNYATFEAKNTSCSSDCGPEGVNCVYLGPKAFGFKGNANQSFFLDTNAKAPFFG